MIVQADSLIGNAWEHLGIGGTGFVIGATAMRFARDVVSYAVDTYPTPQTAMGRWFLGVIRKCVGEAKQLSAPETTAVGATGGN